MVIQSVLSILFFPPLHRKKVIQMHLLGIGTCTVLLNNQNTSRKWKIRYTYILIILKLICVCNIKPDYILFLKGQCKAGSIYIPSCPTELNTPFQNKITMQGEFLMYAEGWKLRERFMQKVTGGGKKISKANLLRITPSSSDHGKGYLRPQPAKNYPYDLFHWLPPCLAGLITFKKTILCLQNESFSFVSDSKHFEFNRSPCCYLGIRLVLST